MTQTNSTSTRKPISELRKLTSQLDTVVARIETNKSKIAKIQKSVNADIKIVDDLMKKIHELRAEPVAKNLHE